MNLPIPVCVRAPGRRVSITSVKGALGFIDGLPAELMRLPRWTFARALFLEVERTRKSRDMNPAVRQFRQALSNEKWLDEAKEGDKLGAHLRKTIETPTGRRDVRPARPR